MKQEKYWYIALAIICALTFVGRFWLLRFFPDLSEVIWQMGRYDFAQKSFSIFPFAYKIAGGEIGLLIFTILGTLGSVGIVFERWRKWALGFVFVVLTIILEAQYLVHHIGDVLLSGMIICLLFGQKHKWLFLQIMMALMWLLSGSDKLIHGNWFFGEAMHWILQDKAITYSWMSNVFSEHEWAVKILGTITPFIQVAIGVSMVGYILTHNKHLRFWGGLILPGIMCLGFLGHTVGLLPFKVILCSLAFFLPAQKLKIPDRKHWPLAVPILYLAALLILNAPSLRIGKNENYYFAPFTYVDQPYMSEVQYQKDLIDKSPWLLDRYTRFYATYKFFLSNNRLSE